MMGFILLTQVVWRDNKDCQTQEERPVLVNAEEIQTAETIQPSSETIITFKLAAYVRVKETPEEIYKKIMPTGVYYQKNPLDVPISNLPDQSEPDMVSGLPGVTPLDRGKK